MQLAASMSPGGRTFQIVVAATKSWGIGKGESPWAGRLRARRRCNYPAAAVPSLASCPQPCQLKLPGCVAAGGSLPWSLPGDMKYFKELTSRTSDPAKQVCPVPSLAAIFACKQLGNKRCRVACRCWHSVVA